MYRVFAICASGIGTSLFARKLISESIAALGYDMKGISVGCIGILESKGIKAELLITTETLARSIPKKEGTDIAVVKNMINDKAKMIEALTPILDKACADGKIKKA